jgi:hypothetical protein
LGMMDGGDGGDVGDAGGCAEVPNRPPDFWKQLLLPLLEPLREHNVAMRHRCCDGVPSLVSGGE